jgi:small subunit ribosomal protein S6
MKHRYEALLILRTQGKEEGIKEVIDRLTVDFKTDGANVEQVQKMDKRAFATVAGDLDSGFYANFVFSAEPVVLDRLKARLTLDADVYRQHYVRLPAKKVAKAAAAE